MKNQPGFFRRTFFTWGHRNTVEAVAAGLADGGAVDGYVWEAMARQYPRYLERIRIVERSPEFGFPPLVTHRDLPEAIHTRLATTLHEMHTDTDGLSLLKALYLDRFVPGDPADYDTIADMMTATDQLSLVVRS